MKNQKSKVPASAGSTMLYLLILRKQHRDKNQNYNKKFKLITYVLIFLTFNFSLLTFNLRHASAQSLSLSISPPLLEVFIKPGKSVTQQYKLTNNGERENITIKLGQLNEYGINPENTSASDNWITLRESDIDFNRPFTLEKGQSKQFLLRIQPPADLTQQDYYRALVFTTETLEPGQTSQSSVSQSIVSPLLITVTSTGQVSKAGTIPNFEVPKFLDSFGPLMANIIVENTGNTYFRPIGRVTLSGPFAKGNFEIDPIVYLPGSKKKLTTNTSGKSKSTLFLPGFFLGKYQIQANFTLDESNIKIDQTKTFYALPWKAGLFLLVLFLVIFLARRLRKKRK